MIIHANVASLFDKSYPQTFKFAASSVWDDVLSLLFIEIVVYNFICDLIE